MEQANRTSCRSGASSVPTPLSEVVIYPARVDERERRMAQNEALFREVNERVEAVAHQLGPEVPYEFVCECANADCTFRVATRSATTRRSGRIQSSSSCSPCTTHQRSKISWPSEDSYWLVRKSGEAGDDVEKLDPRSR